MLLALAIIVPCGWSMAVEGVPVGRRYKVVRPLFLMGVYESLNDRRVSRDAARAYLDAARYYETAWVAFQDTVPIGTVVTIQATAPKRWNFFSATGRYLVRLDPDLSRGLDVVLTLDRGIEGDLDGLNPEMFERSE